MNDFAFHFLLELCRCLKRGIQNGNFLRLMVFFFYDNFSKNKISEYLMIL